MANETEKRPISNYRTITAKQFAKVDLSKVTVVDLRDENLLLAQGEIPGAYNVPLDQIGTGLRDLDRDKPVYVICNNGDFSGEVAEILADRGYEAYDIEDGFGAYRKLHQEREERGQIAAAQPKPPDAADVSNQDKASIEIDAKGLKCPGPIVALADALKDAPAGAVALIEASEDAFASDVRVWCERTGNELLSLDVCPQHIAVRVKKGAANVPTQDANAARRSNDKTFIVFSGDLDKTIAAFIMANGAAAMGRKVTMFFTFWGLNILRRPKKVRVAKTPIGKLFGAMMPRGTRKLGLSRMNFGGAGAKMIRSVMKRNGISSLEELIDQARAHGVRLVACQMSMEIMGIAKAELIDGVELGGVATFLGSGEQSDMSLFI